jgi:hypothetical protein
VEHLMAAATREGEGKPLMAIFSMTGVIPDYDDGWQSKHGSTMARHSAPLAELLRRMDSGAGSLLSPPLFFKNESETIREHVYCYGGSEVLREHPRLRAEVPTSPGFLSSLSTGSRGSSTLGASEGAPRTCVEEEVPGVYLGAVGTCSPLHYDLNHGLLAQVRGRKRVWLFPPSEREQLYLRGPFPGANQLHRQSAVDIHAPDHGAFPRFARASGYEVTLEPGQMLFIPALWFHEIAAVDGVGVDGTDGPICVSVRYSLGTLSDRDFHDMRVAWLEDRWAVKWKDGKFR